MDPVLACVIPEGPSQGVVVLDMDGSVDIVQDHVGDAEHVGKGFFIHAANGVLQLFFFLCGFHVIFSFMFDGASQKTAGAAGRVEDGLLQFRVHPVDDKARHGAGGIELPGVPRALQVL